MPVYIVPERLLLPAKCDSSGVLILRVDVGPGRLVHWRVRTQILFSDAEVMVHEAYGNVVGGAQPVEAGSGIAGFVDYDDWNLGDIPLPKNADAHRIVCVNIAAIQVRCCDLGILGSDRSRNVLGYLCRVLTCYKLRTILGCESRQ